MAMVRAYPYFTISCFIWGVPYFIPYFIPLFHSYFIACKESATGARTNSHFTHSDCSAIAGSSIDR